MASCKRDFLCTLMRFLYVLIAVWVCAEILPQLHIHQLESVQNLYIAFYAKFPSLHQVFALAEPGDPWHLHVTFAPGRLGYL